MNSEINREHDRYGLAKTPVAFSLSQRERAAR